MNETQLKSLANLVLLNDQRLGLITNILGKLIERNIAAGDYDGSLISLLSTIEQTSASVRDSEAALPETRKFFGLE